MRRDLEVVEEGSVVILEVPPVQLELEGGDGGELVGGRNRRLGGGEGCKADARLGVDVFLERS